MFEKPSWDDLQVALFTFTSPIYIGIKNCIIVHSIGMRLASVEWD